MSAPSTSELKRYYQLLNETFRKFFKTNECKDSPEGFAVLVKDVGEYVRAITHIMDKKVWFNVNFVSGIASVVSSVL